MASQPFYIDTSEVVGNVVVKKQQKSALPVSAFTIEHHGIQKPWCSCAAQTLPVETQIQLKSPSSQHTRQGSYFWFEPYQMWLCLNTKTLFSRISQSCYNIPKEKSPHTITKPHVLQNCPKTSSLNQRRNFETVSLPNRVIHSRITSISFNYLLTI